MRNLIALGWLLAYGALIAPVSAMGADYGDWEDGWAFFKQTGETEDAAGDSTDPEPTNAIGECPIGLYHGGSPCWCQDNGPIDDLDEPMSCVNPFGGDDALLNDFARRNERESPDFSEPLRGEPPPPPRDQCQDNNHAAGCVQKECGHYPCKSCPVACEGCGTSQCEPEPHIRNPCECFKCQGNHGKVDDCHYLNGCKSAGKHAKSNCGCNKCAGDHTKIENCHYPNGCESANKHEKSDCGCNKCVGDHAKIGNCHFPPGCESAGNHETANCGCIFCEGNHDKIADCHYPDGCESAGKHDTSGATACNKFHHYKCNSPTEAHYVCSAYATDYDIMGCGMCFGKFHGLLTSHMRREHGVP